MFARNDVSCHHHVCSRGKGCSDHFVCVMVLQWSASFRSALSSLGLDETEGLGKVRLVATGKNSPLPNQLPP